MKNEKKTHWLRNTLLILAGCAVLGIIISVILFARDNNRTYAYAGLSFTFDGAQDGLAPNGYAFDINEMNSEEVLTAALDDAGMSGKYTVEDISPNLVVQGEYPEDLLSQLTKYTSLTNSESSTAYTLTSYHPTTFSVRLYNDFDTSVSKSDLNALLNSILISYREWFAKTYSMGKIEDISADAVKDYDYFQQLEILRFNIAQAADYADELAEMDPSLQLNAKGFSDLSLQFNNMINSDLSRLNATMTMNAVSKDLERLKGQYRFEIQDLQDQVKIQTDLMSNMDLLISTYGKSGIIYLSTTDALTKVDRESSKIYDSLVDLRNEVSAGISDLNNQITNYQNKLKELESGEDAEGAAEAAVAVAAAEEAGAAAADDIAADDIDVLEDITDVSDIADIADIAEAIEVSEDTSEMDVLLSDATDIQKEVILESGILRLIDKNNAAVEELNELIDELNSQEINDLSVAQSAVRYKAPSIVSGTFIALAVKTCGPICALGLIVALILLIRSRRKERKAA